MGDLSDDLELALRLADVADDISRRWWRDPALDVQVKPDNSLVTNADKEVEARLREVLARARPDDTVLGEEEGLTGDPDGRRRWIFDPIDGTANYARGRHGFGALIALAVDGTPVVGVVSMPALHERWWGAVGVTADSTGGPIAVSTMESLEEAHVAYSGPAVWRRRGYGDGIERVRAASYEMYTVGDASAFGNLASGRYEAVLCPGGKVWDFAASYAVMTAAGAVVTDVAGQPRADTGTLVAANPTLHPQILALLGSAA
ncbi:inositol monophosphatase family protein [Fodinicola acaciae]|uniref:inositol monophosphatase family protein n=1 Tax=Fodinicola acaciae TaxID=2681555 RepID=UPI0013CF80D2|nr:inositol monophosphatase family protein [Fodinicola acaciae]